MGTRILSDGNGHLFGGHRWERVDNEISELRKMGIDSVEIIDSFYAKYRSLYRCKCGAEMISEEAALI